MKRIALAFKLAKVLMQLQYRKLRFHQLYICISTPCYGNIGDHAIELAQQEILDECGLNNRYLDISSVEYSYLKKILKKVIDKNDVIIIDGGGNFGDTWPTTMQNINAIVSTYIDNRIYIFPESWFFTDTEKGAQLLEETSYIFNSHKNIVLYARDSWSYHEMKRYLEKVSVKYSFDTVLFKNYSQENSQHNKKKKIGLSMRDDKECVDGSLIKSLYRDLKSIDIETIVICNDSYGCIDKKDREQAFRNIIELYEECDAIITDRFHGFIFSILCHKPCMVIDNATGKIGHFYEDIKNDINGCLYINSGMYDQKLLVDFIKSKDELILSDRFYKNREKYLNNMKKDILRWREKK